MKLAVVGMDAAALVTMVGAAEHLIPVFAALLAVVWYGFVIWDRIVYGPELEKRMLWQYRRKRTITHAKGGTETIATEVKALQPEAPKEGQAPK